MISGLLRQPTAASVLSNSLGRPSHIMTSSRGLSFLHPSQSIIKYSIMRKLFEQSQIADTLLSLALDNRHSFMIIELSLSKT
jgi:hypothetical protein